MKAYAAEEVPALDVGVEDGGDVVGDHAGEEGPPRHPRVPPRADLLLGGGGGGRAWVGGGYLCGGGCMSDEVCVGVCVHGVSFPPLLFVRDCVCLYACLCVWERWVGLGGLTWITAFLKTKTTPPPREGGVQPIQRLGASQLPVFSLRTSPPPIQCLKKIQPRTDGGQNGKIESQETSRE